MKYLYLFILIVLFHPVQLLAQRNFKPGYVVSLKGDTTKGLVDYRDWIQNPGNVFFKTLDNDAGNMYLPAQLKAFGVDGLESYITYTGAVTTAPVKLADVEIGINTGKEDKIVFLRMLVSGPKASLLVYNDKIKTRFFIAGESNTPVELEQYVYKNNQGTSVIEQKDYIGQLQKIAAKYEPENTMLQRRIERVSYNQYEIERIIIAVNGAESSSKIVVPKREGARFFIGVGGNFNNTAFSSVSPAVDNNIFSAGVSTNSFGPAFSAGVDYYFNRNSGRLLLRAEASVAVSKVNTSYKHEFTDFARRFTVDETIYIDQQLNVSVNPQLVYNLVNNKKLKFYVAGGLQFNKVFYNNDHYYIDYYLNGELVSHNDRTIALRGLYINPTARVGVVLPNIFELFAGYNPPAELLNAKEVSAQMSTIKFGINYHFGFK